ncbi:MAG TPA: TonB-dependent receptor, partial [Pyrinomonadaceae bacterium]|nr:TonB-dependent receptor [Pyrinomonadaceae bacterium]
NGNEVIASYVPPSDIVQEFKVQTATFDAQFGNTEGGVTSISIKSGTNNLHGTGYYYNEPLSLAANDSFGKGRGQAKVDTQSKRYGGSISGPVRFPWLYNGKDKSFFLFGYEEIRDTRPRFDIGNAWTPTEAMRRGDFTGLGVTIWDPASRINIGTVASPIWQAQTSWTGQIPTNRLSPVALKILSFYGPPKTTATGSNKVTGNLSDATLTEATSPYRNWTFRVDQNLTSKNRLFVRGSRYDRTSVYGEYLGSEATGTNFIFASRQGVIDDVHIFNGSTVLNVKYGYNRFIRWQDQEKDAQGFDLTRLGFASSYNSLVSDFVRRFPRFTFSGGSGSNMIDNGFSNEFRPTTTHAPSVTLNKTFSKHSMKFGAELRIYREDDVFASNDQTGQFTFNNTYVRRQSNVTETDPEGMQAFAAFLLGLPTTLTIQRRADYSEYSKTYGYFVQDDWKIKSKLTLNLGLRYEVETPLIERNNKSIIGFDQNYVHQDAQDAARARITANPFNGYDGNPFAASSFNVKGRLIFADANNRGGYKTPKGTFLPRVGFAYQYDDKTVVRGGFGMFAGFLGQRRGDVIQGAGFSRSTTVALTTVGGVAGASPIPQLMDLGFSTTTILEPLGVAQGATAGLGGAITFFNPNPKVSKQARYQIGFQRELPWGIYMEAMYVGNYGWDIEIGRNINALPSQYLSTDNSRSAAQIANNTKLSTSVVNPFLGRSEFAGTSFATAANFSLTNFLRPFSAFGDINTTVNDGKSWYNSGQFTLSKRLTQGFQAQMSYTFSKWIQATEFLNAGDARPTKMIGDQDTPHRLSFNFTYQLPFGKGMRFANGVGRVGNAVIGGWKMGGVFAYQVGFPVSFGTDAFYNGTRIGIKSENNTAWFDTSGFTSVFNSTATLAQPLSHLRTLPLRFSDVRRDNINQMDLSFLKDISFSETMKIRLSLELFNAFNEPYLVAPQTNPQNSSFGTIPISTATQDNYARRAQLGIKFIF